MDDSETTVGLARFFNETYPPHTEPKNSPFRIGQWLKINLTKKLTKPPDLAPSEGKFDPGNETQESQNGELSNEIKDFPNANFSARVVSVVWGSNFPDQPDQSNEIKDFSACSENGESHENACVQNGVAEAQQGKGKPDQPDWPASEESDPEITPFLNLNLPATVPASEIIPTIKGASGSSTWIDFPCPFFDRKCDTPHALGGHGIEH